MNESMALVVFALPLASSPAGNGRGVTPLSAPAFFALPTPSNPGGEMW